MSHLRRRAAEAKNLLGELGELRRVASVATVYPAEDGSAAWVVSALDSSGDGGIFDTIFSGPEARTRALEYAREKYAGLQLCEPHPQ